MKIKELRKRRNQIISVAKWCFLKRGMLKNRKDIYIADLNSQLKGIFSDIIDSEMGEGIIYDELVMIPVIFERYENDLEVNKHRKEIIEYIYNIIIRYAQIINSRNIKGNPEAPGESEGR